MNKKTLLVVLITLIVLGGGYYLYTNSDQYIAKYGKTKYVDGPLGGKVKVEHVGQQIALERSTEGQITSIDDGRSQYTSREWGLSFAYPSTWKLTELGYNTEVVKDGGLATVQVKGDGYSISFSTISKDYPGGVDTVTRQYVVDGQKVKALEDKYGNGFMQGIAICEGMSMDISSPVTSKEITDQVIASVKCGK